MYRMVSLIRAGDVPIDRSKRLYPGLYPMDTHSINRSLVIDKYKKSVTCVHRIHDTYDIGVGKDG